MRGFQVPPAKRKVLWVKDKDYHHCLIGTIMKYFDEESILVGLFASLALVCDVLL